MSTPAGWYPQEDGRQRYWDGAQWTEHFAPGAGASEATPAAEPTWPQAAPVVAATTAQRPWFKKKRFVIPGGIAAFFLVIGMAGAASGEEAPQPTRTAALVSASPSPTPTPTAKTAEATATPPATPNPSPTKAAVPAAPTPTATKAAVKPTPAPAPKPKPKPKPPVAKTLGARTWQKIVKDPDSYSGKRYIVYGEIRQFDAATGTDTFLADVAHRNTTSYGFFDGENTMLTGDEAKLADFVEGDVFKATVTVVGSFSYDTQIGGNTTVPMLTINSVRRIGNNS
jgi:hypothetical protein